MIRTPYSIQKSRLLTTYTSKSQHRMVSIIHAKRTSSEKTNIPVSFSRLSFIQSDLASPSHRWTVRRSKFQGGEICLAWDIFFFSPSFLNVCLHTMHVELIEARVTVRFSYNWIVILRAPVGHWPPLDACCPPQSSVNRTMVLDLEFAIDGVFRSSSTGP